MTASELISLLCGLLTVRNGLETVLPDEIGVEMLVFERRELKPKYAEKRVNNKYITLCGVGYGTRTLHCVHPIFPNMAFPSCFIKTLNFVNLLISVVRLTMTVKAK